MNTDIAASVAFGALVLYALVAIVGRSLLHRRRTGSTGWRGVHGRPGSASWWGGVLLGLSCVGFIAAPLVAMLIAPGPASPLSPLLLGAGALLFALGSAITVVAQSQMGDAWRIGVDAGERTSLRTSGLFAWSRNPVFLGMLLAGLAIVAWVPLALPAWLALALGIELQVRVVEEPYLLSVHGPNYRDYARRTGRFFPGVGHGLGG